MTMVHPDFVHNLPPRQCNKCGGRTFLTGLAHLPIRMCEGCERCDKHCTCSA